MKPTTTSAYSTALAAKNAVPWSPFFEPIRWLGALLGGLLGMALATAFFGELEIAVFVEFLKGQVGLFSHPSINGALGFAGMGDYPWVFVLLAVGAAAGAALGYVLVLMLLHIEAELKSAIFSHPKANAVALGVLLFALPVIAYIPAMTAGFIWDDDQEISSNASLLQRFPIPGKYDTFNTNWRGPWEIWTGGLSSERDDDAERVKNGKTPAPWLVRQLRGPLMKVERALFDHPFYNPTREKYRFDDNQSADYFPLKTSMLWLEYQLWGYKVDGRGFPIAQPEPFHIMNILIHALDAVLLWVLLRRLRLPGAWFGALLFALHPVHAESVAWIAERKNTLSLFFCLLSVLAWLRYHAAAAASRRKWYIGSLLLFVGALLCKTHVVILPPVLVLLDWWNTGKSPVANLLAAWRGYLQTQQTRATIAAAEGVAPQPAELGELIQDSLLALWRDIRAILPFFVIALLLALVTIWFQNDRAVGTEMIPIGNGASRLAGAGVVTWLYLGKALWPSNLTTIYANNDWLWWPLTHPQAWQFLAGFLVLAALGGFLWMALRKGDKGTRADRAPFFVLAFFVGTLFPTLGFFKMSYMRLTLQADHFQYFSDIALLALAAAAAAWLYQRADRAWRPVVVGACVLLTLFYTAYSWERAGVHQGEKTLWADCLKRNPESWQAHNHMGAVLHSEAQQARNSNKELAEAKIRQAAYHFQRAVDLKPANPEVHNNLGLVFWHYGRFDEALAQYREAVRIKGDVMALRRNLADALLQRAGQEQQKAANRQPADADLMRNCQKDAIEQYLTILKDIPNEPAVLTNLSVAYTMLGQLDDARAPIEKARQLAPNYQPTTDQYNRLRQIFQQMNRPWQ